MDYEPYFVSLICLLVLVLLNGIKIGLMLFIISGVVGILAGTFGSISTYRKKL